MRNFILNCFILLLSAVTGYYSYLHLNVKYSVIGIFVSGVLFGIFLMILKLNSKNSRLNSYKRELEKESVSSSEASARVKILESKVKVLEKALENALNK